MTKVRVQKLVLTERSLRDQHDGKDSGASVVEGANEAFDDGQATLQSG